MPNGTPISRHCVVVLNDGRVVVDWENSLFQDVVTGEFFHVSEQEICFTAREEDLDTLRLSGCVECFDPFQVYFLGLPEQPHRTLD